MLEKKMHVFPESDSSCETRIYVFLRTSGFQNVTFNYKHREGANVKDVVHTNEFTDVSTMQTSCGDMCAHVSLPMPSPCGLVVGICVHV